MNLEMLETFQNLAKTKNFSRTAELMYLSQSTVTMRIKMLENELGKELIDRKAKGLKLTPSGEMALEYANQILGLCQDCVASVSSLNTFDQRIAIESPESVWYSYLYPSVVKFMNLNPNISFQFITGHTDKIVEDVVSGIVDIGITMGAVKNKDIEVVPYFTDGFELVAAPDFQIYDACITPQNIRKYPFVHVLWGEKFNDWYRIACGYQGHSVEVQQFYLLLHLLKAGGAISFLPRRNAEPLLKEGKIIRVPFDFGSGPPEDVIDIIYMKKNKEKALPLVKLLTSAVKQSDAPERESLFW